MTSAGRTDRPGGKAFLPRDEYLRSKRASGPGGGGGPSAAAGSSGTPHREPSVSAPPGGPARTWSRRGDPVVPVTLKQLGTPSEPLALRDKKQLLDLLGQLEDKWVYGRPDRASLASQERESLQEVGEDFNNYSDQEDQGDQGDHADQGDECDINLCGRDATAQDSDGDDAAHASAAPSASAPSAATDASPTREAVEHEDAASPMEDESSSASPAAASSSASPPAAAAAASSHSHVHPPLVPVTIQDSHRHAWMLFGLGAQLDGDGAGLDNTTITDRYKMAIYPVLRLWLFFTQCEYIGNHSNEAMENRKRLMRVLEVITTIRDLVEADFRLMAAAFPQKGIEINDSANLFKFATIDYSICTPFQKLLLMLLKTLHKKGYQRFREGVGEQERNAAGTATTAFKRVQSVSDFVYGALRKETDFNSWYNSTVSRSNVKDAITHLSQASELEFPEVVMDRHIFAFENGELDVSSRTFLPWNKIGERGHQRAASKFFPGQVIDPYWMTDECRTDWFNKIPTPLFEKPMAHQQFSPEKQMMVYVMSGRGLFWLNDKDNWEAIAFGRGRSGTGKSTWGRVMRFFYDLADVAVLSSNMEKKYGLSSAASKLLWINYEMNANAEMDQMDFQSMVTGEEVLINTKYITATTVEWKIPGFMFGNMMNRRWTDTSGQLKRRIIPFEYNFKVKPEDMDPQLLRKINTTEMAALAVKYMWAYTETALCHGHQSIWDWCPKEFEEAASRLHAQTNSLTAFMETDIVVKSTEGYIRFERFNELYQQFCKKNMSKPIPLNDDTILKDIFEEHGLAMCKNQARYANGEICTGNWILGVSEGETSSVNAALGHGGGGDYHNNNHAGGASSSGSPSMGLHGGGGGGGHGRPPLSHHKSGGQHSAAAAATSHPREPIPVSLLPSFGAAAAASPVGPVGPAGPGGPACVSLQGMPSGGGAQSNKRKRQGLACAAPLVALSSAASATAAAATAAANKRPKVHHGRVSHNAGAAAAAVPSGQAVNMDDGDNYPFAQEQEQPDWVERERLEEE
jgi:hypothetical protein